MNKIYKVIWSKARNCYVAVSELAKNHAKGCSVKRLGRVALAGVVAGSILFSAGSAWADDPEPSGDTTTPQSNFDLTEHITDKESLDSEKFDNNTIPEGATDNSVYGFGNTLYSGGYYYVRGEQNIYDSYYGYTQEERNKIKNGWTGVLSDGNNMIVGSNNTIGGKGSLIIGNGNEMTGQNISKHMSYNMYGWSHGSGWKNRTDEIYTPAENSIIIGSGSNLSGNQSVVLGNNSSAGGDSESLITLYNTNTPSWFSNLASTYYENNKITGGENNTAVGESSHSTGFFNTAIGQGSIAAGEYVKVRDEFDYRQYNGESVGVAIKPPAVIHSTTKGSVNSTAVGQNAIAIGNQNTALGQGAAVYGGVTETSENYWTDWMYDAMQHLSGKDYNGGKLDHKITQTFTAASNSTAIGENAIAVGNQNTVIGQGSHIASNTSYYGEYSEGYENSTAVGQSSWIQGSKSTAIGQSASVTGESSTAIGQGVGVTGDYNIAAGSGATIYNGNYNVAIGYNAGSGGSYSNSGSSDYNTAVGARSSATGTSNTAYGDSAVSIGYNSTALGSKSSSGFRREIWENDKLIGYAYGGNDTAVGQGSRAMGHNNIAIGTGSVAGNWSDLSFEQRMNTYLSSDQQSAAYEAAQQAADQIARSGLPENQSSWNSYQQYQYNTIFSQVLPDQINQKLNDAVFKQWQQGQDSQGKQIISDEYSTAVGAGATAAGAGQTAIGGMAKAPGWHSTAVGLGSSADGASAIAIGESANTHDNQEIAIGHYAQTYGQSSIALGHYAGGNTNYAIVIGDSATVQYRPEEQWVISGYNEDGTAIANPEDQTNHVQRLVADQSIAIGRNSYVDGKDATAVGRNTQARMRNATAYGNNAHANAWNSIAIGNKATAGMQKNILDTDGKILADTFGDNGDLLTGATSGNSAVAIGNRARAVAEYTTAIGAGTNAQGWHAVAVGDSNQATGRFSTAIGSGWSINHTDGEDDLDNTTDDATGDGVNTEGLRTYESIGANVAAGDFSTSVGYGNTTVSEHSLAVGAGNVIGNADGERDASGIVLGGDENATGSIAFGNWNKVTGKQSIAVGTGHEISGDYSGAFGDPNKIYANRSYALGNNNTIGVDGDKTKGANTFVVGNNVTTTEDNTVVVGYHSEEQEPVHTFGKDSVSLGTDARAMIEGSVALGAFSIAKRDKANGGAGAGYDVTTKTNYAGQDAGSPTWTSTLAAVSVGGAEDDTDAKIGTAASATRQITGVAAGTADTDAVNVAQLRLAGTRVEQGNNITVTSKPSETGGTVYTVNGLKTEVTSNDLTVKITGGKANDKGVITYDLSVDADKVDTNTTYSYTDTTEEAKKDNKSVVQQITVTENKPDGTTEEVAKFTDTHNGLKNDTNSVTYVDGKGSVTITDQDGNTTTINNIQDTTYTSTVTKEGLKEGEVSKLTITNDITGDKTEFVDTNTHTTVVDDGKGFVTVTKNKDATDTAGPEYMVSVNVEKLKGEVDTNTTYKFDTTKTEDTSTTNVVSTTKVKSSTDGKTYTETGETFSDTDTKYTGTQSVTGGGKGVGSTTFNITNNYDDTSSSMTIKAGDNVTITKDEKSGAAVINATDTTYSYTDTTEEAKKDNKSVVQQITVTENKPDGTTEVAKFTDTHNGLKNDTNSVTYVDGKGSVTIYDQDGNSTTINNIENTTYTAQQSVTTGDDWGKGSTTYTLKDNTGKKLKPMNLKAGKNVKITKGKNGEAVIQGNGLTGDTYEVKYDDKGVGSVTIKDEAGNTATITNIQNVGGEGIADSINYLGNRINNLDNKINKVGAGAAALAGLHPLDFDPDEKWDFSAAAGSYKGEHAVAIGAFYRPNEDTMFSIGGTIGNGNNMVNVGVSWKFGQKNRISANRISSAKEIIELRKNQEDVHSFLADAVAGNQLDLSKIQLFPDVEENHWAYDYVATMAGNGVLEGYPDGYFKGNRNMTRYEMAAVLYRLMQNGARLSDRALTEFAPELDRIRVDTITHHKDGTPHIQRVRTIKERVDEKADPSSEKNAKKKAKVKVAEKPVE